jgi:hypothetical protein
MTARSFAPWLRAAGLGGFLVATLVPPPALAQSNKITWDIPTPVTRRAKPKAKARPRPRVERVPLLTLEWSVFKVEGDGTKHEANPNAIFYTHDKIQLAVKPNQPGYLYILNQNEGKNGEVVSPPKLIFPASHINGGQNFVKKNQELILPGDFPAEITPPAGRVVLFVVFSRDLVTDLPDKIAEGGAVPIAQSFINELKNAKQKVNSTSRPDVSPEKGGGAGRYATWVQNTNPKNNEELVVTIVLKNEDRPTD